MSNVRLQSQPRERLAGARRVFEVLDRDAVVIDSLGATSLPLQPRSLIPEAVGLEYSSDQKILQRIDVKIEPGKSVAFVGSSGAGKSTLLNLLLPFYDSPAGTVRLDQYDLQEDKAERRPSSYRIGFAGQRDPTDDDSREHSLWLPGDESRTNPRGGATGRREQFHRSVAGQIPNSIA